jgi:uncharacterized protein YuzE
VKISYSKHADVLYIVLSATANHCSYVELPNGIITRIDDDSQQVVGVTIYNFMQRMEEGERLSIPEIGDDLSGAALLSQYMQAS